MSEGRLLARESPQPDLEACAAPHSDLAPLSQQVKLALLSQRIQFALLPQQIQVALL
ncbi:hypothetical protein HDG41_006758, partial [Paraburkholderia sp. JPY162]|nr:hypothetical protein [Paraburkholderia youngii]